MIYAALIAIVAFIAGLKIGHPNDLQLIQAYDEYNKATEELLDSLDREYNWADAFDPYDYYESRAKLDSLLWDK